jgi:hypothetical protein
MKNSGVFDYAIWVDRSDHLPPEAKDSMSIEQWMTDYTIDNNRTLEGLEFNTKVLMNHLHSQLKDWDQYLWGQGDIMGIAV